MYEALRRSLPKRLLRGLARRPMLVVGAATLGTRIGRDALAVKRGEMDPFEFRLRTGSHIGAVSGSVAGAAAGAFVGSVVPVLGNVLGGFAGGIVGDKAGGKLGRAAVHAVETVLGTIPDDDGIKNRKRSL